jgi:hypothetical protein
MERVTHNKKPSRFREFWPGRQGPPYDAAIFAVIVMGTIAVVIHLCR